MSGELAGVLGGSFVAVGGLIGVILLTRWLVREGFAGGDQPGDARTRVGTDGRLLVSNPGETTIVVGVTLYRYRPGPLDRLRPHLHVRRGRRGERAHGAEILLGAVEAGGQREWDLPGLAGPGRVVVSIGHGFGRLTVHEHLVRVRRAPRPAPDPRP